MLLQNRFNCPPHLVFKNNWTGNHQAIYSGKFFGSWYGSRQMMKLSDGNGTLQTAIKGIFQTVTGWMYDIVKLECYLLAGYDTHSPKLVELWPKVYDNFTWWILTAEPRGPLVLLPPGPAARWNFPVQHSIAALHWTLLNVIAKVPSPGTWSVLRSVLKMHNASLLQRILTLFRFGAVGDWKWSGPARDRGLEGYFHGRLCRSASSREIRYNLCSEINGIIWCTLCSWFSGNQHGRSLPNPSTRYIWHHWGRNWRTLWV